MRAMAMGTEKQLPASMHPMSKLLLELLSDLAAFTNELE